MSRSISWGRRPDGEPIFWTHTQNLNERRHGPSGPIWRHGRAWLHYNDGNPSDHRDRCLGAEWVLFQKDPWPKIGIEINQTFCSEADLSTTLKLPWLGALYLHAEGFFPRRWKGDAKNTSIALYHENLWIEFWWTDPAETWGENKNRCPAFRISFDWQSFLFGKQQHKLEWLSRDVGHWWQVDAESNWRPIQIPMPEGSYPARYRIERRTWKRSRWPRKLVCVSADVEIPKGIAIPGKGENSWDCGEDAHMGMGCSETDEAAIIAHVVQQTLEARERYGGSVRWQPATAENLGDGL